MAKAISFQRGVGCVVLASNGRVLQLLVARCPTELVGLWRVLVADAVELAWEVLLVAFPLRLARRRRRRSTATCKGMVKGQARQSSAMLSSALVSDSRVRIGYDKDYGLGE